MRKWGKGRRKELREKEARPSCLQFGRTGPHYSFGLLLKTSLFLWSCFPFSLGCFACRDWPGTQQSSGSLSQWNVHLWPVSAQEGRLLSARAWVRPPPSHGARPHEGNSWLSYFNLAHKGFFVVVAGPQALGEKITHLLHSYLHSRAVLLFHVCFPCAFPWHQERKCAWSWAGHPILR